MNFSAVIKANHQIIESFITTDQAAADKYLAARYTQDTPTIAVPDVKLTDLEKIVMRDIGSNDYNNGNYEDGAWLFCSFETTGEKIGRGVLSSLVKKGIVCTYVDPKPTTNSYVNESSVSFTDIGECYYIWQVLNKEIVEFADISVTAKAKVIKTEAADISHNKPVQIIREVIRANPKLGINKIIEKCMKAGATNVGTIRTQFYSKGKRWDK